jgi:peptidoglycan-associated lipoprotein
MKTRFVQLGLPLLAATLFAGCATQGTEDASGASNTPAATASSPQHAGVPQASRSASTAPGSGSQAKSAPSMRSVYYEFDSAQIAEQGRKVIDANAQYLREHADTKVRIEGNADERGSAEYNLALGQRRAESVMQAMRLSGLPEDRMEAVSYGKEKPKASGHDEKSWAENRRSDILYR